MRFRLAVAFVALPLAVSAQGAPRTDPTALQRLLVAEDHRGTGHDGIQPIVAGLTSTDTLLRRVAARAAGRLQRPVLGVALVPLLRDPLPAVRREAANGIAQSVAHLPRTAPAGDAAQFTVRGASDALTAGLRTEQHPSVIGALAASLGRLPHPDSTAARSAEAAIIARSNGAPSREMMQGLYRLAQARRFTGALTPSTVAVVRRAAVASTDPTVRRIALSTLTLTAAMDSLTVSAALRDPDEQVRRLGIEAVVALPAAQRAEAVRRAAADPSHVVRLGAIVGARAGTRQADCSVLLDLTNDAMPIVALTALDALGAPCNDTPAAIAVLERHLTTPVTSGPAAHRWHPAARALKALARVDSARARRHLPRFVTATGWGERIAAAVAATTLGDVATLRTLAADRDHNVQEAAIEGLARHARHDADAVYIGALASPGYQVVLAAATALQGTTHGGALDAAFESLRRISAEQRETSRDPRLALLQRIGELGSKEHSPRLLGYLADFDSSVAVAAAGILSRWHERPLTAQPKPLPIRADPLAPLLLQGEARLTVTMARESGGGTFVIRLFADDAPATAARLLQLALKGYYNGKILQRVEPNFVAQGGGGDASEYVGDGPFMRDELALRSHFRGSIGISTRGRDTGDAQWYVDLADNPRLDHEYTIAGEIISGLDVADRILPGDVIGSIELDEFGAPARGISPPEGEDPRVREAVMDVPQGAPGVEQTTHGTAPAARMVASFDGLGVGFVGPQGTATVRNPSDNSLAVGPDHIVQIVNTRMAIFTKAGKRFPESGHVLYGPVETRNVWRGFGGLCEQRNNGDAVARYDQLADRWLIVMPIFSRGPTRPDDAPAPKDGEGAKRMVVGRSGQPGAAAPLFIPGPPEPIVPGTAAAPRPTAPRDSGQYAMCYAVSTSSDPMGSYYRYEFVRPLFPDYPRPAVWPDGWYLPSSTGDDVIEKHACVADRTRMLRGEPATEQCITVAGVNFLNNVDLDGYALPPAGAPNLVLATGGTQLKNFLQDDGIYAWQFRVNWDDPSKTRLDGPTKLAVAPYHYLCGGQLTNCVPQPGVERKLDSQGDKLMARVVYRRIGNVESVVATHSINTAAGAGGVRWYEFRIGKDRMPSLYQQGTYAPDATYRWLPSPAIDKFGNIGIGYSAGSATQFPEQRFAGRRPSDPLGVLSLRESRMVIGEGSQTNTLRWEDYTQTAVDPSDDCTIWLVGDYYRPGAANYSSRIGAYRMPGCR